RAGILESDRALPLAPGRPAADRLRPADPACARAGPARCVRARAAHLARGRVQRGRQRGAARFDAVPNRGSAHASAAVAAARPPVLSLAESVRRPTRGLLRLSPLPLGGGWPPRLGRVRRARLLHEGGLDLLRLVAAHAPLPVTR